MRISTIKKLIAEDFLSFSIHQTFALAAIVCMASVLSLAGVPSAMGQTTYGSIVGTVNDPSGAALAGVAVTLTNVDTSDKRSATSDGSGNYQFVNLLPGNYTVEFEKQGFSRLRRESITVVVQTAARVDATLALGEVTQTVDVGTQAPIIETQPGSLGQLVEGKQVQEMPLNGRNVFNLLILAPGVVPQGSTGGNPLGNQAGGVFTNNTGFGNYQIGGGMSNESAFYLDGVPLNTTYINSPALVPTQDAIQEFRVDSNAVSAEFGRFAGGVVNMASRSGSNAFHGSAYEYIRNKVLNANVFTNKDNPAAGIIPRPAFTQNQYGVTVGGPIRRDKVFGFFSWEAFSFRKGNPTTLTVPIPDFYTGNFKSICPSYDSNGVCNSPIGTQLYDPLTTCGITGAPACATGQAPGRQPFAYNIIPLSRLDPASKQFFTYYGPQNQPPAISPTTSLPTNNFKANVSLGGGTEQYTGRMDWNVSPDQRVFGRYTYWSGTSIPNDPFHTHFGGLFSYTGSQNFVIGDTYTFSAHTVSDFRLSYLRATNGFTPEQVGTNLNSFGPAWGALASQVTLPVAPLASNGWGAFNGTDNRAITNDYSLSGNLTRIVGHHTFKFGGEGRRNEWNFEQSGSAAGSFTFDQGFTAQLNPITGAQLTNTGYAGASFFLGNPASGSAASIAYTDSIEWYAAAYFQDTWMLNKLFTITPGIRWEFPEAFTEHNNRLTILQPNVADPLGAVVGLPLTGQMALVASPAYPSRQLIDNRYKLFSPRVNVAFTPNETTSVRAGYGLSWIPPDMVNYSESPFQSPVNAATTTMVPSVGGTSEIYPYATFGNPFPTGLIPPIGHNPSQLSIFEGQSILSPIPNEPFGYAQQWDLEVQQQFGQGLMADISYAGSKGTHLSYSTRQLNQLPDSLLSMGTALNTLVTNPFYGHIASGLLSTAKVAEGQLLRPHPQFQNFQDTAAEVGDSHWDALETRLVKRFKTGGVISASYTWSKLISNTDTLTSWLENHGAAGVQDWNNLRAEKSLATYDVPNRFVVSYVLNLPFGTNQRFFGSTGPVMNRIIGGWSINGITTLQSGFPLAFTMYSNQTGSLGGGSRPNVVPGVNKKVAGSAQSRFVANNGTWFNTAAFATPNPYTFGNESRLDNTLRDAGIANWDFTAGKAIPISERLNFDFKAEIFNLFNRVQFGDPNTQKNSPTFGQVSTQLNTPRLVQFTGRFTF
jgi:hypothetical protein